jgi:hypothetical protein
MKEYREKLRELIEPLIKSRNKDYLYYHIGIQLDKLCNERYILQYSFKVQDDYSIKLAYKISGYDYDEIIIVNKVERRRQKLSKLDEES